MDHEGERDLVRLAVFDNEFGAVDVDLDNFDLDAALVSSCVVEVRHVAALIFGRDADGESCDLDVMDEDRSAEELAPAEDAEGEAIDSDHGAVAGEVVGVELEPGAGDLEAFKEGNLEFVEFDAAVKAGAEGFDDFRFQDGTGAVEEDVAGDEGRDDEDGEDGANPDEDAAEPAVAVKGGGWGG